jgi:hypothetical protein
VNSAESSRLAANSIATTTADDRQIFFSLLKACAASILREVRELEKQSKSIEA